MVELKVYLSLITKTKKIEIELFCPRKKEDFIIYNKKTSFLRFYKSQIQEDMLHLK